MARLSHPHGRVTRSDLALAPLLGPCSTGMPAPPEPLQRQARPPQAGQAAQAAKTAQAAQAPQAAPRGPISPGSSLSSRVLLTAEWRVGSSGPETCRTYPCAVPGDPPSTG